MAISRFIDRIPEREGKPIEIAKLDHGFLNGRHSEIERTDLMSRQKPFQSLDTSSFSR